MNFHNCDDICFWVLQLQTLLSRLFLMMWLKIILFRIRIFEAWKLPRSFSWKLFQIQLNSTSDSFFVFVRRSVMSHKSWCSCTLRIEPCFCFCQFSYSRKANNVESWYNIFQTKLIIFGGRFLIYYITYYVRPKNSQNNTFFYLNLCPQLHLKYSYE